MSCVAKEILEIQVKMAVKYAPIVKLDKGLVRGTVEPVDDSDIYLYQGLRYGRANRFEKAQPVEPWTGVYDATTVRDCPPQLGLKLPHKGYTSHSYSEDCLLLNLWKPTRVSSASGPRSVMVYIFGGHLRTGSIFKITHDGRWISHRGDVIVVTINYRLGPFGFMFGDDREAPANLGIHDQILALQWVQENISNFGGDPKSVTIFGNSAGGVCVGALILSPLTKGLFQRAILQSGHPFKIVHKDESLETIKSIATCLNCDDSASNMSELIQKLKTKSTEELLNAAQNIPDTGLFLVYGDELLPARPEETLMSGNYNYNIDLMYGTVSDEGSIFMHSDYPEFDQEEKYTLENTREYISKVVGQPHGVDAAHFYMNISGLSNASSEKEFRQLVFRAVGDFIVSACVIQFGEYHAKHSTAHANRIYAYRLTQKADVHVVTVTTPKFMGTCHADELFYLFTITRQCKPEDIKLSHQLTRAWAQFAKLGHPGSVGCVEWTPAVVNGDLTTRLMELGYETSMVSDVHKQTCNNFWKDRLFV